MLQIFPAVLRNAPGNLVVVKPGWLYYNESIRARGPQGTVFYRRKNVKNELVIVLDFGGQYNQLVARRVRAADSIISLSQDVSGNVMCTVRFILTKQILRRSKP